MARSLSDIALRDEAKEVWPDARPQPPEADPRFTFHASRFTILGSGQRTTQMVADRSPQ